MGFDYYWYRVRKDKLKLFFIAFIIIIPLLDIGCIAYEQIKYPESIPPDPLFATFNALYTVGNNHLLHKVLFWFMPLYLLVICGEDSLEDYQCKYINLLKSRIGRSKYIMGKARNSFLLSGMVVFFALMLNLLVLVLIFDRGGYIKFDVTDVYPGNVDAIGYNHPLTVNIMNIVMCAVLAGLSGMAGNLLSQSIHDRKIVYGICFLIWFTFVQMDGGLMHILHPFASMSIVTVIARFLIICCGYGIISAVIFLIEEKSDEVQ